MKRTRLSRSGSKARSARMKTVPKFTSFYMLDSYLAGKGLSRILDDIVELEFKESKHLDRTRDKTRERVLLWWNEGAEASDITYQRSSYVLMHQLKSKMLEKGMV